MIKRKHYKDSTITAICTKRYGMSMQGVADNIEYLKGIINIGYKLDSGGGASNFNSSNSSRNCHHYFYRNEILPCVLGAD